MWILDSKSSLIFLSLKDDFPNISNIFSFSDLNFDNKRTRKTNQSNAYYNVTFDKFEVTCSCPHYLNLKFKQMKNECCKHVAVCIKKMNIDLQGLYTGRNAYTLKEYETIKPLLESFDENRQIGATNKATFSTNERERIIPDLTNFNEGPHSKHKEALAQAPPPMWYAEYYCPLEKRGRIPECRGIACSNKISKQGTLCLRANVIETFSPDYLKQAKLKILLQSVPYRLCPNVNCLKEVKKKAYIFSNYTTPELINLNYVKNELRTIMRKNLEGLQVQFEDDQE